MIGSSRPFPSSRLLFTSEVGGWTQHVTPEPPIPSPCPSPCMREEGVELDNPSGVLSVLIVCPPRGECQGLLGGEEGPPAAIGEDGSPHLGRREMRGNIRGQVQCNCCDPETLHSVPLVSIGSPRLPSSPSQQSGPPQTSCDPSIRRNIWPRACVCACV